MTEENGSDDDILLKMTPHTEAKHRILRSYLNAWLPIMLQGYGNGRVLYLDGFAGPGEYVGGAVGSPIIALDCANDHMLKANFRGEAVFDFIEIRADRKDHLDKILEMRYGPLKEETYARLPKTYKVQTINGDFNSVTKKILGDLEASKQSLAPTMAFIDPFGYSDLDIEVLARILRFKKCELLITYMSGFIDRFASEEKHRKSIIQTLKISEEDLSKASEIPNKEQRELVWLKYLNDAVVRTTQIISETPSEVYKLYFKMLDARNNTLYYLVYFTKSEAGMRVMKYAMSKVGKDWSYRFSDYDFDPSASSILNYVDEKPWIKEEAERIYSRFKGQKAFAIQVRSFVTLETIWSFSSKSLRLLEEDGRVACLGGRQKNMSYPDTAMLQFK